MDPHLDKQEIMQSTYLVNCMQKFRFTSTNVYLNPENLDLTLIQS